MKEHKQLVNATIKRSVQSFVYHGNGPVAGHGGLASSTKQTKQSSRLAFWHGMHTNIVNTAKQTHQNLWKNKVFQTMEHVRTVWDECTDTKSTALSIVLTSTTALPTDNWQLKQQTKERRRGEGKEQRSRCDLAVRPVTTSPPLQSQTAARNALKHKWGNNYQLLVWWEVPARFKD